MDCAPYIMMLVYDEKGLNKCIFDLRRFYNTMSNTNNTYSSNRQESNDYRKYTRKPSSYGVSNMECVYALSDAGLLHHLRGVSNKKENGVKIFHFDKVPDVKEIIELYTQNQESFSV